MNGLNFSRRELLQLLGFQAAALTLSGSVSVAEAMGRASGRRPAKTPQPVSPDGSGVLRRAGASC